ncbi:MAG: hypothetical protein JNM81_02035 [Rhodospirillaceae bacterium]|nr:hypothetical protein [Rhodospirillaceae bacterium]
MAKAPLKLPTLAAQFDAALTKYRQMLAAPPADSAYLGEDTITWLDMCDAQKRIVQHLKTALRLSPKEAAHGTATART